MDENLGICGRLDILQSQIFKLEDVFEKKNE